MKNEKTLWIVVIILIIAGLIGISILLKIFIEPSKIEEEEKFLKVQISEAKQ